MSDEGAVVVCAELVKVFGTVRAVDGASLVVRRGEILTLIGPSGCGKTTCLRLIAGFEVPDAGTIHLVGKLVAGQGVLVSPERRQVGMVFQDYALFPHLSVARNVAFGLTRLSGAESRERVGEVLELVGLSALGERFPHELSGGQQQRVALARALAPAPELLLLDEPFSNLDAALRARVRTDVHDILRRAHSTAIFVTHDQDEALSLSDQVAVLEHGRVLQVGTPEEVYRYPAQLDVARVLGEANVLPGEAADGVAWSELGMLTLDDRHIRGHVEVLVRPESIGVELASDDAADETPVARVIRREFFGHDQRAVVRLASNREVTVRLGPYPALRPGVLVRLRVGQGVSAYPASTSPVT